ncbi:MAG: spore cortex biosynthesis protein YabQ [Clostridiales bacterium]|nr:spore cortex biosynthesis protein YabQ [Clostridiales bacterium]
MPIITISSQFRLFFLSCALGFVCGVIYDFFKILRLTFLKKNFAIFLCDLFYFVVLTFLTFCFAMVYNKGELRWFIFAGETAGLMAYRLLLSRFVVGFSLKILKAIFYVVKKIFGVFLKPFKWIYALICRFMQLFVKNDKNEE